MFHVFQELNYNLKGSCVFEAIGKSVSNFYSWEKWTGFTNGAKAMMASKTGLVRHLKQLGINVVFFII